MNNEAIKSSDEYELGNLLRFVLILLTMIWKNMRTYARISPMGKMLETLIKPRKNKDIQGYEKICKEK